MIFAITLHQPWREDTQAPPPFFPPFSPFVTQLPLSKVWLYYKITEITVRLKKKINKQKKSHYGIFMC